LRNSNIFLFGTRCALLRFSIGARKGRNKTKTLQAFATVRDIARRQGATLFERHTECSLTHVLLPRSRLELISRLSSLTRNVCPWELDCARKW
jgi:hypothetical protein